MHKPGATSNTGFPGLSRREFMKMTLAVSAAVAVAPPAWAAGTQNDIPLRPLGRTGEKVSAIGLGGYHVGTQANEELSLRIIRSAIDRGITFMDNC